MSGMLTDRDLDLALYVADAKPITHETTDDELTDIVEKAFGECRAFTDISRIVEGHEGYTSSELLEVVNEYWSELESEALEGFGVRRAELRREREQQILD